MTGRNRTGRKKTAAWLLAAGILSTLLSLSVLAQSRSTSAFVGFVSEPATKPVAPVDPDWPGRETIAIHNGTPVPTGKPEFIGQTPGATGAIGWLSINYVTPLRYSVEVAPGAFAVEGQRPYLQTSDLRGTASGWKVTAIAGPFQDPGEGFPVPAILSFCGGSANSRHTEWSPPRIPGRIELPANGGTQRLIALAGRNEGVGIWVARWYPQNGAAQDARLRLFSQVSNGKLGYVLWVMNDAP